ncbi:MAG: hypothetical protein KAJ19_25355, partial [Gammaproteobacteria bacterium]|nr:hypothetical protein [Gammaproteobacteria bacterium]
AASGDSKALEAYDKALRERIRAIDPVYAEELDELQEQYDRKETVEQREARQARERTEQDFREQERITRRELGDQLEAWRFHAGQRGENERRAMDNLITDNEHRLQILYDNANRRLAELDLIWKHYGHAHGASYVTELQHVLSSYTPSLPTPVGPAPYTPIPPGYTFPETNPWAASAPASLAGMEGGTGVTVSIGNLVVPGSFTPQQGRQFGRDVAEALGPELRKQHR